MRGIDAYRKSGTVAVPVFISLRGQPKLIATLGCERETDLAARTPDEKMDLGRRYELRRTDEIAFILPILIIGHDDELPGANILDRLLDGPELHAIPVPARDTELRDAAHTFL